MLRKVWNTLRGWHADLRRSKHIYMMLLALAIGLLGGLAAVGFRELIRLLQLASWWQDANLLEHITSLPWWWKIAVPTAGMLIVGFIVHIFAREAKGHGVPEVIEAVTLRSGRIRPRVAIAKMLASGICIATGGSVGREGPIVQIGSSLGSSVGQWLMISERRLRTLVGCGAAAGIAATFNAPVAGALFAVEIILSDFGVAQFSPIVISSVSATVISQYFLGDAPAFIVPAYSLVNPFELIAYAVLGLVAAVVAVAFVKSLYGVEDAFERIRLFPPLKTALGGVIIGLLALRFPEILGVGYETIEMALGGELILGMLLVLVVVKIFAVSVTIGSGGSGGIFAPSLFIGAMTGGAIGVITNQFIPLGVAGPGAYALVGMAAVVAASTHAPLTAIVIVFELTNDYKIILPLMISCIIATILATRLQRASIYLQKLLRRGIDIHMGQSVDVLQHLPVSAVMRRDFAETRIDASLKRVVERFMEKPGNSIFVLDHDRHLRGLITLDQIRPVITETDALDTLAIANDIMIEDGFPVFKPDDCLADVMKKLAGHVYEAPVVQNGSIVGSVWPDDVIERYNAEIFKRDTASGLAATFDGYTPAISIPGVRDVKLAEIKVPPRCVGRTLGELNIRKRFGISILMIKCNRRGQPELVDTNPTAETVLHRDDVVVALGTETQLTRFERD
jgi:CIC family chloride channel protein